MRSLPFVAALIGSTLLAQTPAPAAAPDTAAPVTPAAPDFEQQRLGKKIDDLMWYLKLGDAAVIDTVVYTSLPARVAPNPTARGAKNPLMIHAYTFIPKNLDRSKKHPLLVYVHGGVHGDFNTAGAHIVRELVDQGYSIIAPDYRGSTGHGGGFYRQIDYGGRENDDVKAARDWMIETHSFLDEKRVGILGWSHGGMITLMNIFNWPESYAVAYAGVPVSDLVQRLGYSSEAYRRIFSDSNHIGKTVNADIMEYRRRSPVYHVKKLATPLLIHTNTNDDDVDVLEVEHLIEALKAEGKKFEYKIYQDAPGGHTFNRIDTKLARESRAEVWRFLAPYLKPANPAK